MSNAETPSSMAWPDGVLHALQLDGVGGAREVPWDNVNQWSRERGFLWIHLDFEQPGIQEWLRESSGLNDIACRALTSAETRPRALNRGDNLLLTLRGINLNPGEDPEDMVSVRIWTDGVRLISSRRRQLSSTQDVLEEFSAGDGPCDTVELLVTWIEHITARMSDTIESFEDRILSVETELLSESIVDNAAARVLLVNLRRQIITVRRYLAPQRDAMNRLIGENLTWVDELSRLQLREINDRLSRHIEDMDEVRDRAVVAQEELANQIAEQINARSYLFTVVAVIFLPLGFLTGLLGINVGGMPGVDDDTAFWQVVALCALVGLGLTAVFRWRRWL